MDLENTTEALRSLLTAVLLLIAFAGWQAYCSGLLRARNALSLAFQMGLGFAIAVAAWLTSAAAFQTWSGVQVAAFSQETAGLPLLCLAPLGAALALGAGQERMRSGAVLLFCVFYAALIAPLAQILAAQLPMNAISPPAPAGAWLFASAAGCGLALAASVGPRTEKYGAYGKIYPLVGHHSPLSMLGFSFFLSGLLAFALLSDWPLLQSATSLIAMPAGGMLGGALLSRFLSGRTDLSLSWSGALAAAAMSASGGMAISPGASAFSGLAAGVAGAAAVLLCDRLRIDDPTAAAGPFLTGALLGPLAAALRSDPFLSGGLAYAALMAGGAFLGTLLPALLLRKMGWLRVSEAEELRGLDLSAHGHDAYSGFQIIHLK
ncbi:MAG: hypothetical protein K1X75_00695 [Leptospirales bacterium]|nr:hypothetical protein [Leptospirales bacterium]